MTTCILHPAFHIYTFQSINEDGAQLVYWNIGPVGPFLVRSFVAVQFVGDAFSKMAFWTQHWNPLQYGSGGAKNANLHVINDHHVYWMGSL
jgi:hypothetical protein